MIVPLDECFYVIGFDAKNSIVKDTFVLRASVLIFVQLGTLFYVLLYKLVFEPRHGLFNFILAWGRSLQPWVIFDLVKSWSVIEIVGKHPKYKIFEF